MKKKICKSATNVSYYFKKLKVSKYEALYNRSNQKYNKTNMLRRASHNVHFPTLSNNQVCVQIGPNGYFNRGSGISY